MPHEPKQIRRPFDPIVLQQLSDGNVDALVTAVASFAQTLLEQAGLHPVAVFACDLVALEPMKAGKAAAAVDLLRLLSHAPQGREALRDLGLEPVLHQIERE